ncbi:toxin [Kocuria kalidii]|uniref:toxin n=1 Tax=Kocuria kalidii TaxID=3376283 RepID=UPI0037B00E31
MEIHRSARKHGIDDADVRQAADGFLVADPIGDDAPARELCLGVDTRGRLLETVVPFLDNGVELIVHAWLKSA